MEKTMFFPGTSDSRSLSHPPPGPAALSLHSLYARMKLQHHRRRQTRTVSPRHRLKLIELNRQKELDTTVKWNSIKVA